MSNMTFFERIRNSRASRIICAFLALNFIIELISPAAAMALTSGPSQPEFSSFEPVATTDMVNDFTGDFTYNLPVLNVPGPDGGGYSMSLSYHSGVSSEEEASWVGFGWTLNPGAINRNKRGYADEFNGVNVQHYSKTKPNWTQTAKFDLNMEYDSRDDKPKDKSGDGKSGKSSVKFVSKFACPKPQPPAGNTPATNGDGSPVDGLSISLSHTVRYNNYTGFSLGTGIGIGFKNMGSLSMNHSGAQNTLGFSVNPIAIVQGIINASKKDVLVNSQTTATAPNSQPVKTGLLARLKNNNYKQTGLRMLNHCYPINSYNVPALPYSVGKNSSAAWNFSGSFQFNIGELPIGFQIGIAGHMNVQAMEASNTMAAYGYMHSVAGRDDEHMLDNRVFDYQVEKESTFDKKDKTLGIPYNTADIFSATGNGVIGGFRLQQEKIGSFYPNHSTSVTKIRQIGIEGGIGDVIQIGMDVGTGKQKTVVSGKWPINVNYTNRDFNTSRLNMRFTNDPGGEINYGDDYDSILNSTILFTKKLVLGNKFDLNLNHDKFQSSSSIDYEQSADSINPSINSIKITNKDGGKSNYTLPVYTKNEAELTTGIDRFQDGNYLAVQPLNYNNPLINKTINGQKTEAQYASSYLLTSNTTFNYVDADNVTGPSVDDFGGWTKFDYRQAYGGSGDWYHYRSPYAGLRYNSGKVMDPTDQTGSMSCGDKEVYYLKCIETKSHIAFFITNATKTADFATDFPADKYPLLYTGTGSSAMPISSLLPYLAGSGDTRFDGVDAMAITNDYDKASEAFDNHGNHKLQKLERIVLFAKTDLSKPLTTTYFDYNYTLCRGIPNYSTTGSPANGGGKLTLKKVWTESNGIIRSQIAPYQFHYEYFNNYPSSVTSKYSWANDLNNYVTNDAKQNPVYSPAQLDAWGFYQENGNKRFENMQPWLSQRDMSAAAYSYTPSPGNSDSFDPAAWQLKRIQLPSGGEIHINYEQKDYNSVEDKTPMAMVSLSEDINNMDDYTSDKSAFCINADDLGVNDNTDTYMAKLKDYFITNRNKLYFKILYAFTGNDVPQLNTENRRYQYITGYTTVHDVVFVNNKIQLKLGDMRDGDNNSGKTDKTLPRWVGYQELETNGGRNLGPNAAGYKGEDYTDNIYNDPSLPVDVEDVKTVARSKVLVHTIAMFADWITFKVKNVSKQKACKKINYDLSYFKLPVFKAKKGGGIRVKRLLMYDPGISGETGDAMVYGSEYIYKNEDGTSSGVAVNEPGSMREESAMVSFIERKKQKNMDKILNGKDTKQFEGPLGENLLPGASVVYSRIIIQNIHDKKSTTGYMVNSYHTAKEFPMEVDYTPISKKDKTYRKFNISVPLGIFNLDIHRAFVSQGFIFKLNDMNGKIASKATYTGVYNADTFKEGFFTGKTTYDYSAPGEKISSLVYDGGKITRQLLNPGMEEDFTIFTSNVHEKANDFSFELDYNFSIPVPPTITFAQSYSYSDNLLCQHVVTKVVNRTSYLLSTTTTNDGVTQTTKNLAFDKYTNEPVLTQTFDGYGDPYNQIRTKQGGTVSNHQGNYYAFNIPASWVYSSMGQKTQNNTNTNQLTAMAGNVVTYSTNVMWDKLLSDQIWNPGTNPLTNVVSASATVYKNNWFTGMAGDYPAMTATSVYNAAQSFYYPLRSYNYLDNVTDANTGTNKIYSAGTVSQPFAFFDWIGVANNATISPQWYSDSKATKYSPNGYPLEEEDVLGIKSSARFGYNDQLPVVVAKNAGFNEIKFTDFEYGVSGTALTKRFAHSGKSSLLLSAEPAHVFVTDYNFSQAMFNRGVTIKLWLKSVQNTVANFGLKNPLPKLKAVVGSKKFDFTAIAQTGEWTLYSTDMRTFTGLSAGTYNILLEYNYIQGTPGEDVYVDDFRIQPLDASANCSVYYPDNKLAAQFDDQHFGVFYEYNNKGQLVRKSIETERGKKMLQEQQYNTPLIDR